MFILNKLFYGETAPEAEEKDVSGEQLKTQVVDDWVVVDPCDKENSGQSCQATCPQHSHHHSHHHHHLLHHHNLPQQNHMPHACHPQVTAGLDSLCQGSTTGIADEFLDDADSLANSLSGCDHATCLSPLHDCGNVNFDMDSDSDTESTPESVFSASSGRSHATYRPRGNASEPWVVAPSPCFTGSQVGDTDIISHSPMENLLIEHPSMSVYLSMPQLCLPLTHRLPYIRLTGDGHRDVQEEVQEVSVATAPTQPERPEQAGGDLVVQTRNRLVHAMLSPGLATPEQLVRKMRCAQRSQCCKTQKNISNRRCDIQNKVYEHLGQSKANNRRNKRSRPSGFKSSRVNQRM